MLFWFMVGIGLACLTSVNGHGYMIKPAARNSLWRVDNRSPRQDTDNELNCGGFAQQHLKQGGQCGVCGDPANTKSPRYEKNGRFVNGLIAATYEEGQMIDVVVQITANHQGVFIYRLENRDSSLPTTEKDRTGTLMMADGSPHYVLKGHGKGLFSMKVKLPDGFVCDSCVFRWWWKVGNNWGCDSDSGKRECGLGHGPQETFVNCADIRIVPKGGRPNPTRPAPSTRSPLNTNKPPMTSRPIRTRPTQKPGGTDFKCVGVGPHKGKATIEAWCERACKKGRCNSTYCNCKRV